MLAACCLHWSACGCCCCVAHCSVSESSPLPKFHHLTTTANLMNKSTGAHVGIAGCCSVQTLRHTQASSAREQFVVAAPAVPNSELYHARSMHV